MNWIFLSLDQNLCLNSNITFERNLGISLYSLFFMKVKIVLNSYLGLPVMYCLLEAVSVYPEKLATKFVDKTEWIKVCPHDMFISLRIQVFQTN